MTSRHFQAEVSKQGHTPCLPSKAAIVDEHSWAAGGGCRGHLGVSQLLLLPQASQRLRAVSAKEKAYMPFGDTKVVIVSLLHHVD